jgi:glucose/arabinose dehydrogenase
MQPHRHAAVSFRLWPCRSTPSANRPLLALVLFALLLPLTPASTDSLAPLTAPPAATLRPGFQESVVFSGLTNPTAVRFAPDGRVFVAEKSGLIKVFPSLTATSPTIFADLRTNVHNFWDRGLLGMALDPNFSTNPYVYVLYTYDAAIGGTAPRWGSPGGTSDGCPTPPGATGDGCVVSGRLSRLQAAGNVMTGPEQVLINDWCQQYPSHSVGSVVFGADGKLYASAGDGASFTFLDYGQDGDPPNPCGDPPGGVGTALSPPTAEGGSLRSQSLRRPAPRPVTLDGTIIRVDPATGAGLPDNPLASDANANARRIVAYGLRNPFRITVRPGTNEIWIGDVGANEWEEINRVTNPTDAVVENFGWPCYEGNSRFAFNQLGVNSCETLYSAGPSAVTAPYFTYPHRQPVFPNDICPTGSSSLAGLAFAFYSGSSYPAEYNGALFFADYSRNCIWAMKATGGLPDRGKIETFVVGAASPVDLQIGPGGDLFYADFDGGTIRRIQYIGTNRPPTAVATAQPTSGPAPLMVQFDGSGSTDPDGDPITYAWDLNGDGLYTDSTLQKPTYTYSQAGSYTARLVVTDSRGGSSTPAAVTITVGTPPSNPPPSSTSPTAFISTPAAGTTWKVNDVIQFAGSATDSQGRPLPASALSWSVVLQHCPSTCHPHQLQTFTGVASGSFPAPDHEYPSYLEFHLTATDSAGQTDTDLRRLDPQTVVLTVGATPASGFELAVGVTSQASPFTRTVIVGSTNTLSAPSPQTVRGQTYTFQSWSDGGAQTHSITAPAAATTYTARYRKR